MTAKIAIAPMDVLPRRHLLPQRALIDLLDWKAGLDPRCEPARDLGSAAAQGDLRANGVLAEVDGARPLWTRNVLGERDRYRPRWRSVAATLDLGPQIENLREAELDRVPRRLRLKSSRHGVNLREGRVATASGISGTGRAPQRLRENRERLLHSPAG